MSAKSVSVIAFLPPKGKLLFTLRKKGAAFLSPEEAETSVGVILRGWRNALDNLTTGG
jgi:hypothetical protein